MIQYDYINATFINDVTETVQYHCWNDQLMSFIIIIRYNSFAYLFLNILMISYLSALGSKLEINVKCFVLFGNQQPALVIKNWNRECSYLFLPSTAIYHGRFVKSVICVYENIHLEFCPGQWIYTSKLEINIPSGAYK